MPKKPARKLPANSASSQIDIASITRVLRGNPKRLRTAFSEVRSAIPPSAYPELISGFRDNPFYRLKIFGEAFPKSASHFKRLQPLQPLGRIEELRWAESLVLHYAEPLRAMLDYRARIIALVQADEYEAAAQELDRLDVEHGLSIWSYSLRFVLQSRLLGPDANNNTYSELRNTPGINGLIYFILFYLGFRNSPGSTVQHIAEQVPSIEQVGAPLSLYLSHKLAPFSYGRKRHESGLIEALVRHEANSSTFDLACSLFRSMCLAMEGREVASIELTRIVNRLRTAVDSGQLRALSALLLPQEIVFDSKNAKVLDALDEIVRADFDLSEHRLANLLGALGWNGRVQGGLAQEIANKLEVLAQVTGERQAAADTVERLCTTLSSFDEAFCLMGIARRFWLAPECLSLFGSLQGVLTSGFVLPDAAEFVEDDGDAELYLMQLEDAYGCRPSIDIFKALRLGSAETLPPRIQRFVRALRASRGGDKPTAIAFLEAEKIESSPALNVDALTAKWQFETTELNAAVTTIARACVHNRSSWAQMPVVEVVDAILQLGLVPDDMLSWSYVLDVASEHFDAKYARQRSYAVEDTWEGRGVASPSAMAAKFTAEEKALGVAYLRTLCTADILSDSDQFQTVRELEEERIKVCQALTDLDAENAGEYLSEIKSITRWLVIYDGLRTVEQSKVYVDVDGLRNHLLVTSGPEYDRMLALRREKTAIGDIDSLLKKDVVKYRDDEIVGNLLLRYAFEDPLKILRYLLVTVFNEYASNSRFGLDVYLSTRIRHGTLKGHLRSPLEDHRLMCQRSGGEYQDQPHWLQRISEVSLSSETATLNAIKEFSQLIDEDIAQLNSKFLRLRSPENPDGWFNIVPTEGDLAQVNIFFEYEQPSYANFLDLAFESLNIRLEEQLIDVQRHLRFTLRQRWARHLRDLREAVQAGGSLQLRSEIDSAIAAGQVAVDLAIDRVASWFALSTAQENPDYTVELAIDIASRSIDNCFGSSVLTVRSAENEGPSLQGRTLASLVDVFFILFENIVKHAKVDTNAIADVAVARNGRFYTITVTNSLPSNYDGSKLDDRLSYIRESLVSESEDRLVTEGGTGYHKLRKILEHDLRVEHDFDFGVAEGAYNVTLIIDAEAVLA